MDRLVASGGYVDHSQAIAAAIQNLGAIHSAMQEGSSLVIERGALEELASSATPVEPPAPAIASSQPIARSKLPPIPALFRRRERTALPEQFAPVAIERAPAGGIAPIDTWIFGQYNRLLPAKVTCRALINLIADGEDRQPLHLLAKSIANEAAKVGQGLAALDEMRHLGRDDATAVAFPCHPSEFKSIQRFANQFVASANKEGELSGLPVSLKLVARHPAYAEGIFLTKAGWDFGMMENPLLDHSSTSNTRKFSDDEIAFLLNHICTSVPVEAAAFKTILTEVDQGILTPDDLDEALTKLPGHSKKMLAQYVSTQRSGAICRMADLDLISRLRTGTRVSYMFNSRGKDFLRSTHLDAAAATKTVRT
ncbi:MAG: hypothetical protein ACYC1L_19060 [Alphaproteobacteria bacterium]